MAATEVVMLPGMGLLCDYFVAPSDDDAAATIDWAGGPSRPEGDNAAYEVVSLNGIEPVVVLGQLEAVLTGRPVMDILRDPGHKQVAIRDGGERLVIPVGARLEQALATLEQPAILGVAEAWSQAEELYGRAQADDLADVIRQLAALAHTAQATRRHVYCWMCV